MALLGKDNGHGIRWGRITYDPVSGEFSNQDFTSFWDSFDSIELINRHNEKIEVQMEMAKERLDRFIKATNNLLKIIKNETAKASK
jgi:hypothetical protein